MTILINGMEMPKDSEMLYINIYPSGKVTIGMDLRCKQIATAAPIPPHGRLIDADALETDTEYDQYLDDFTSYSHEQIRMAPTIIPADPAEPAEEDE